MSAFDGLVTTTRCVACGTKEARMALKTTRPSRAVLKTTIYYDDRTAPKDAARYCRACGLATAHQLIATATHADG